MAAFFQLSPIRQFMKRRWVFNTRFFLVLGIALGILTSCHITYQVRNDNKNLNEVFATPCGTVTMQLEGRGNSKFIFRQIYHQDSTVHVFPDSVKIYYNGVDQAVKGTLRGQKPVAMIKMKKEEYRLEFVFDLAPGVFDGDSIMIISDAFLECHGQALSFDTLIYSFQNPVRIYGINSLP